MHFAMTQPGWIPHVSSYGLLWQKMYANDSRVVIVEKKTPSTSAVHGYYIACACAKWAVALL